MQEHKSLTNLNTDGEFGSKCHLLCNERQRLCQWHTLPQHLIRVVLMKAVYTIQCTYPVKSCIKYQGMQILPIDIVSNEDHATFMLSCSQQTKYVWMLYISVQVGAQCMSMFTM